jgi:hypothetical protein
MIEKLYPKLKFLICRSNIKVAVTGTHERVMSEGTLK